MAKKSEGKEVRRALDGPDVTHDELIEFALARNADDTRAASVSATSRALIGGFIDKTGVNSQALSWCRSILKKLPKDNGQVKAMDVIRSLEKMLPMVKAHVAGQSTPDMFGKDDGDPVDPLPEGEEVPTEAEMAATFGEGDDDSGPYDDDLDDADDFNAAVDRATVVPFTGAAVG